MSAFATARARGAPFRFPERVVAIASYLGYDPSEAFRSGHCYLSTSRQQLDVMQTCMKLARADDVSN